MASVHEERNVPTYSIPEPELVRCFRHDCEGCPRCDGSGYRPRNRCAGCDEPPVGPVEGAEPLWGFATVGGETSPSTAWAATPN
jgi:hypothetical protein